MFSRTVPSRFVPLRIALKRGDYVAMLPSRITVISTKSSHECEKCSSDAELPTSAGTHDECRGYGRADGRFKVTGVPLPLPRHPPLPLKSLLPERWDKQRLLFVRLLSGSLSRVFFLWFRARSSYLGRIMYIALPLRHIC